MGSDIPVFRGPTSHIIQAVGQESGLYILGFVKDEFRFDAYSVGPAGIAFFLPGRFAVVQLAAPFAGAETSGLGKRTANPE